MPATLTAVTHEDEEGTATANNLLECANATRLVEIVHAAQGGGKHRVWEQTKDVSQ